MPKIGTGHARVSRACPLDRHAVALFAHFFLKHNNVNQQLLPLFVHSQQQTLQSIPITMGIVTPTVGHRSPRLQSSLDGVKKTNECDTEGENKASAGKMAALCYIGNFTLQSSSSKMRHTVNSIPLEEMEYLMTEYGPEGRKYEAKAKSKSCKTASIRRKFARWFPDFFRYFVYDHYHQKYVPVLGERVEKLRRRHMSERRKSNPERMNL